MTCTWLCVDCPYLKILWFTLISWFFFPFSSRFCGLSGSFISSHSKRSGCETGYRWTTREMLLTKKTHSHMVSKLSVLWRKIDVNSYGDSMAEWSGPWSYNLVVPGSSPLPCYSLDLFLVAPSSTPWLCFVNSQLVCLLLVRVFKHFMYIWNICLFVCMHMSTCKWVYAYYKH